MAVWNSVWPITTSSVQANGSTGASNMNYIETSMVLDHYWNEDPSKDGHHKVVQMPKTETGTPLAPSDPTVVGSMDGALYLKQKVSPLIAGFEAVLPHFKDRTTGPGPAILEMLGIRACAVFSSFGGTIKMQYSHNLKTPDVGPPMVYAIQRFRKGVYFAFFDVELPSDDYMVLGGCLNNNSLENRIADFSLPSAASKAAAGKLTTQFQFRTLDRVESGSDQEVDCTQVWFIVFGG